MSLKPISFLIVLLASLVSDPARGDGPAAPETRKLTAAERKLEAAEHKLKVARRDFEKNTAAYEEAQGQVKEIGKRTEEIAQQMAELHGKDGAAEKAGLQEILLEEKRKLVAVKAEARAAKRNLEVVTRLFKSAESRHAAAERKYGGSRGLASGAAAASSVPAGSAAVASGATGQDPGTAAAAAGASASR